MTGLGTLLQEAREEQGLTIEDLAELTNIRPHFLKAMEAGDFEELPGEAYVRPFLRTYAKALGLDVEQVVLDFEARAVPTVEELASMRERRAQVKAQRRRHFAFSLLIAVVVLASLGYVFYRLFLTL